MRWFTNLHALPKLVLSFGLLTLLNAMTGILALSRLNEESDRVVTAYSRDIEGMAQVDSVASAKLGLARLTRDAILKIDNKDAVAKDVAAFDALWVHGYASVNSLQGILAANALNIPVLLRAESWLRDRERSPFKLAAKNFCFRILGKMISATLPIGTLNAEYWLHYFGEDMPQFLMPYAVDNEYFAYKAAEETAHRQMGEWATRPAYRLQSSD